MLAFAAFEAFATFAAFILYLRILVRRMMMGVA